jgi:hypothetical protein
MTRNTNARIAGFTYLAYIAIAYPSIVLFGKATNAVGTAPKLARIAEHATDMRVAIVLSLASSFAALVLAVTLYAITRDEDRDIAMLAMICRVGEGLTGAVLLLPELERLWLATSAGANAPDAVARLTIGAFLLNGAQDLNVIIPATFFGVGSTLFCFLLLRGRMIPAPLALLGLIGSVLVVVALPLQLVGVLDGILTQLMWLPVAAFEIPLGVLWLIKGDLAKRRPQ